MKNLDKYEAEIIPYKSNFLSVAVCECVLATLLILSVLTLKFFFPKTYNSAKQWYTENAMVDIDIERFINEAENEN